MAFTYAFFFFWDLRISLSFQYEEFEHIPNFFSKLQYPNPFIHRAKAKAMNIQKYTSHNSKKNNKTSTEINPIN